MSLRDSIPDTELTQELDLRPLRRAARHVLLVIREDGSSETHPLPDKGTVTIGRAAQSQIRIEDPSISRHHALLHMGPPICVEDLGSANGTRVHDARLDGQDGGEGAAHEEEVVVSGSKVELAPGDVIHLGSATAFVQHGAPAARPRRLWPHGYFEGCLERECARSERSGGPFAVLRVLVEGALRAGEIEEALATATRSLDTVAAYGPGQYEILLIDAGPVIIDEVRSRLVAGLEGRGAQVRVGVASYPVDGRNPEMLVARAGMRLRGVEAASSTRSVVVEAPAMQRLYRLAVRIADSNITVLLLGETGVGKEVLAEAIHRLSPRRDRPFLRLNCAAFAEQLLESELFGYEKGAFTGAMHSKPGLLETANGGTVFLDEIGELPMATQVKLLRVLEERQVRPVGGLKPRAIDVRFIAATNRDLEAEIDRQAFRQDLYFRLNGISLLIPPLRERATEIMPFARAFIGDFCRKSQRHPIPDISAAAGAILLRYSWPGNIRELRNVMERALLLCAGHEIQAEHLPVEKMHDRLVEPRGISTRPPPPDPAPASSRSAGPPRPVPRPVPRPQADEPTVEIPAPAALDDPDEETLERSPAQLKTQMDLAEKKRVLEALERCAGNQTQAAKLLGISRRTLVTRLEAYQVPRPRKIAPPRP